MSYPAPLSANPANYVSNVVAYGPTIPGENYYKLVEGPNTTTVPTGNVSGEALVWNQTSGAWELTGSTGPLTLGVGTPSAANGGPGSVYIGETAGGGVVQNPTGTPPVTADAQVFIGQLAGQFNIGSKNIAIGYEAGQGASGDVVGKWSSNNIAIGVAAGQGSQTGNTIAIGTNAAQLGQQPNAIAIGNAAGIGAAPYTQQRANTIVINATGQPLSPAGGAATNTLTIAPIRSTQPSGGPPDVTGTILQYDLTTKEVTAIPLSQNLGVLPSVVAYVISGQITRFVIALYGANASEITSFVSPQFPNPTGQTTAPTGIAFNGLYWLVGVSDFSSASPGTTFFRSADGFDWEAGPRQTWNSYGNMCWSNYWRSWYATTTTGLTYYSPDGINWTGGLGSTLVNAYGATAVTSPATGNSIILFAGQTIPPIGLAPATAVSVNGGVNWTAYIATPLTNCYFNNVLVRTASTLGPFALAGVGSDAQPSVPAGNGCIWYSTNNGVTWATTTGSPSANDVYISDIAYNGYIYVAVGKFWSSNEAAIFNSQDGQAWTQVHLGQANDLYSEVAWNGNYYIAVSTLETISSSDGTTWTNATPLTGAPGTGNTVVCAKTLDYGNT